MATPNIQVPLSGLARRLVHDGLLDEAKVHQANAASLKQKLPLVSYLVQNRLLKGRDIAFSAALEFGVPLLDITALDLELDVVKLVAEKLIRKHRALPLHKRGNRLFIAVSDPTNLQGLDEIKFHVGMSTEAILVEDDKLARAIDKAMEDTDTSMAELNDADLDDVDFSGEEDQAARGVVAESEVDDAPVVRFINKVLLDAINRGASDVHFEPYEKTYRVRTRLDGILAEVASPPVALGPKLTARLKVMSRLNIAERRIPQDGRIKLRLSKNRAIDFRVNTCPTLYGEKVVLRILDPSNVRIGVEALGYEEEQQKLFLEAIHKPYGMVLVTGPTGSGKTVSLYTAVNILNQTGVNISTAEDPVEVNMPGVNQVNVNPHVGLSFGSALRAFLRQDPDIILVGEIRDLETAEIAVKAAQTGHMVLSTLHTNDAPQTLTRLANMGVAPYNIASAVHLIIAQRLARRLCNHCKQPIDVPRDALLKEGFSEQDIAEKFTVYGPGGCDQCNSGYKGRVGIYQVMPISEAMGLLIMEGGNALQLAKQAKREGVADLRTSGLRKVKSGLISLDEINRVTKD